MAVDRDTRPEDLNQLRRQRHEAAHKKRRIIFNNDGCDLTHYCKEATPDALLSLRTTPLKGTQVDSIFYSTGGSFGRFKHDSELGDVFSCKAEGFANNKTQDFIDQGTDALRIMVEFCHQSRIECFWTMRMNDIHDSYKAWYAPYIFPQVKKDHPEWLMGSREKPPTQGRMWSAVDYGLQEVRDLALAFHQEICENYDVDGIELDFFRQLTYFKRPAMGQDADQDDRDSMTDLIQRLRAMSERVGLKRGRPILIAVRIPDSVGYCEAIGLDVTRWLKNDLIDLIVASGDFRLNPWETTVKLGKQHGVPVYACLSSAAMRDAEARKVRASLPGWRGRAAQAWNSGASGMCVFNFFNPKSRLWNEIGDPDILARLDKVYCSSARGVKQVSRFLADGERFLGRSVVSPDDPRTLNPSQSVTIDLAVGEHLAGHVEPKPGITLALHIRPLADARHVTVKLNGEPLADGALSGVWCEFAVSPSRIEIGMNRVEVAVTGNVATPPLLHDMALWVRYPRRP
ncbi:MAG: hypothetical protein HN742_12755 [Lentisphaerae bacterium]|jgi:hypothetical protein|nr:hypothetical protein [Lentisphaerota bacterium]MBT4820414.1 hypothetical protein [Lentisphaerota bacterium]MBT5607383.1 hypothetical protein [Lentisphaerota bacterium]MBT7057811.1 hypothetical protein [Lentisphaerota bacterium]MBT7842739.1 hypothetical protein [Lentisphaerota bacterium]